MITPVLISITLFAVLMGAITYFGYRRYARPARVYEQLGATPAFQMPTLDRMHPEDPGLLVHIFEQIGEKVPVDPQDATVIRGDLMAAGYRSDQALPIYLGIRVAGCVGLVILALVFRSFITSNPILAIVIPVGAGFLGYFGPSFFLDHLISARHERIRFGLPD